MVSNAVSRVGTRSAETGNPPTETAAQHAAGGPDTSGLVGEAIEPGHLGRGRLDPPAFAQPVVGLAVAHAVALLDGPELHEHACAGADRGPAHADARGDLVDDGERAHGQGHETTFAQVVADGGRYGMFEFLETKYIAADW